jgi:sugar/nucleoside kinase (ribokinase family)
MNMNKKVTVIGAAVVDVMAGPIDKDIFVEGSVPVETIKFSFGGDALNEAVFLSGMGADCELITLLGNDDTGKKILSCLEENGIHTDKITTTSSIPSATNIVLVDKEGERYFLTNPKSTLRKLSKEHILPHVDDMGDIVSFASIFVSPMLDIKDMEEVFKEIRKKPGRILVADMTTAKKGETIEDLEPLLKYIDYIIPNEKEAAILTGEEDPEKSLEAFVNHGAGGVIIKCGKKGCIYKTEKEQGSVSAYETKALDTTGAGDSFVAGFIYGLTSHLDTEQCCKMGCAAASLVVEKMGTAGIINDAAEVNKRYCKL